jgi:hypothetical protein
MSITIDVTDISSIETRMCPSGSVAFTFEARDVVTRGKRQVTVRLNAMALKEMAAAMHSATGLMRAEVEQVQAKINALVGNAKDCSSVTCFRKRA